MHYIRDLASKDKGKLVVEIANVPQGNYVVEVYKVGYRCNDACTAYLSMGKPSQLTKVQVEQLKNLNDGALNAKELVKVDGNSSLKKVLDIRENDVYFLNIIKL